MTLDDSPLPRQFIAFHGTRCSEDIIRKKGIVFDPDFIYRLMKQTAKRLNIKFADWLNFYSNTVLYTGKDFINMIYGREPYPYRPFVSITARFENASHYAYSNPEIAHDFVSAMAEFAFLKKNKITYEYVGYRKTEFYKFIKKEVWKTLQSIGKPKVVICDLRKGIYNRFGESMNTGINPANINQYVKSIPPKAIISIKPAYKTTDYWKEFNEN